MKKTLLIFLLIFSLKINAQLDTCTFVTDTLVKMFGCGLSQGPCPSMVISIDTSLINYANGLKTYLVCYNHTYPIGCINETQLGSINFGDTIPVTLNKHDFNFFYISACPNYIGNLFAIIVVGKPTLYGQNYYCKPDIILSTAYIVDGCANYCEDDVYTSGNKNCTITNCLATSINEPFKDYIYLFPNPITEKLNIQANNYELSEITLYDLSYRKLFQQIFTNTTTINTEQLAKGMYLYTVRNKNGIIKNGKVIKQ